MLKDIRKQFKNFDGFLVTNPVNVYYLSGFTGTKASILITKSNAYFFTDFRYTQYAKKIVPKSYKVVQVDKKWMKDFPNFIKKLKIKSIGIEENNLTLAKYERLRKQSKGTKLRKSGTIIEKIRVVKTAEELKLLRKSQRINEEVLKEVIKFLKTGKTEKEVEWFILEQIHKKCGDGPSFNPIVAFGSNSSIPHHQNTTRKLKKRDTVLIDMGVKYKHFCSDMTRTFFTAKPTALQEKVYNTVLQAQERAIHKLKADEYVSRITYASWRIIKKAGYAENFQHALGHGVGLDIHELPNLGTKKPYKLKKNMITTIEPGIYLPKNFGVRIEDMVIIDSNGFTNITKAPKQLKDIIIKV